ncbi:MAG: TonB-dependent receptor [Acidimicrobiia bacterium]|nr:TonB-dependent receptor [Acidimicrobiia bacterium]
MISAGTRRNGAAMLARPLLLALAAFAMTGTGSAATDDDVDLIDLDLEDLLNVRVTSVSKKSQTLSHAPAAIYVITQEDIRRSGVTTISEALRMAPGVQVASIDGNKWAISARGFNDRFSNKLLVLIDGRSVYTPLFSGVYWDVQDTVLDDIDRIEVIRGPGATLWGANAVNGVINIITRPAAESQGGLLNAYAGDMERGEGAIRYGGSVKDSGHYRVFIRGFDRGESELDPSGADANDDWGVSRAGLRLDWSRSPQTEFTFLGGLYTGDAGQTARTFIESPPSNAIVSADDDIEGGHALFRWVRGRGGDAELKLQAYYDRTDRRSILLNEERDTFDIELAQNIRLNRANDLVWGVGYRLTQDDIIETPVIRTATATRDDTLFSAFIQDEIEVLASRLSVALGSKFEYNDYTGVEVQPNARVIWNAGESHTVWASVSRATRTPSRVEHTTEIFGLVGPGVLLPGIPGNPFPVPLVTALIGNDRFDSEKLFAHEFGYRVQLHPRASLDIATFWNRYDDLISTSPGTPYCEPSGTAVDVLPPCFLTDSYVVTPLFFGNDIEADTYGIEVASDVHNMPRWRVQTSYSLLKVDVKSSGVDPSLVQDLNRSPEQQLSLRSWTTIGHNVDVDLWVRYTDRLRKIGVESYVTADARVSWTPGDPIELSLVGRNLFDDDRVEYVTLLGDLLPTRVSRSWHARLAWHF